MKNFVKIILSYFGFSLIRSAKEKRLSCHELFNYIWQYHNCVNTVTSVCKSKSVKVPRIIWQFWWQGFEDAPDIVKCATRSVRKFSPNYKIVYLSKYNIDKYIEIPKRIKDLRDRVCGGGGGMSIAHFSDYVRIELLSKYGGIWMDATLFLSQPIPDNILSADFFMPVTSVYSREAIELDYDVMASMAALYYPGNASLVGTNWMIAAKKGSAIVHALQILLNEYWSRENCAKDYLFFLYFFHLAIAVNKSCQAEFNLMPKVENVYPNILRMSYAEPYSKEFISKAKRLSFVHKTTYKNVQDIIRSPRYHGSVLEHILLNEI